MATIQVVGVLHEMAGMNIPRLVCRLCLEGEERDYHVYVDRQTARAVDQLLQERPFRTLRLHPAEGVCLEYAGDLYTRSENPPLERLPAHTPPARCTLYFQLSHGRSRRKYKLEVATQIVRQFHWLLELTAHDPRHAHAVIEA